MCLCQQMTRHRQIPTKLKNRQISQSLSHTSVNEMEKPIRLEPLPLANPRIKRLTAYCNDSPEGLFSAARSESKP
jgi:hypothetical protein